MLHVFLFFGVGHVHLYLALTLWNMLLYIQTTASGAYFMYVVLSLQPALYARFEISTSV